MADRVVRVGASLDANVRNVFRPLVEAARQARRQVDKELQGIGVDLKKSAQKGTSDAGKHLGELPRITGKSVDEIKRQFEQLRKNIGKNLDLSDLAREAERELSRIESAANRSALGIRGGGRGGMDGGSFPYRMGYWTMRNFSKVTPMLNMAQRIAGDIASGAGADFSISNRIGDFVTREQLATQISNSAWIPSSKGAASKPVDPQQILELARGTAITHGLDQQDILGGLSAFVGKTGDLDTAMKSLDSMAKLSKATGSSLEDMLDAAAAVSNQLGEGADKSKVLDSTMRAIAGQGQVGAIEIRDMASNMEKLAAFANDITVDKDTAKTLASVGITDKTASAVAIYGAMAQAARAKGGRRTAQMATQAAFSFVRDLSSKHEMEGLAAAGINVFQDKEKTKFRDPKAIILDVLNYTKGDQAKLTKLIPNENSRAVFRAFAATYNETKGTNKEKLDATSKAFDEYLKVTMSAEEIEKKHSKAMDTSASKVAVFNAKLQEITDKAAEKLLPTLEKLEPTIIKAVDAFAKLVDWAAENPMSAVVAAFAAAVAKAGIEQVLRVGIERAFAGQMATRGLAGAAGAGGAGAGGAGGLLGSIGVAGGIAIAAPLLLKSDASNEDDRIKSQRTAAAWGMAQDPTEMTSEELGQARVETLKKRFGEGNVSKEKIAAEIAAARSYASEYADVPEYTDEYRKMKAAKVIAGSQDLMNIVQGQDMKVSAETLRAIHSTLKTGIKVKVEGPPGGDPSARFPQVDANKPAGHP